MENYPTIKTKAEQTVAEGTSFLTKNWDHIYSTSMYIPKKALQVTGEVYISTQEIVFAYTKVTFCVSQMFSTCYLCSIFQI